MQKLKAVEKILSERVSQAQKVHFSQKKIDYINCKKRSYAEVKKTQIPGKKKN
jgi:hypothetical protein